MALPDPSINPAKTFPSKVKLCPLASSTRLIRATDDLAEKEILTRAAGAALAKHHGIVAIITGEPVDLIETVAERVAALCVAHPLVAAATVTVHKPQAPIGHTFGDVSVTLRREAPSAGGVR